MIKKILLMVIFAGIFFNSGVVEAKSNFEFYFFGINLKSYQECNWVKVTAGAAASLVAHEFAHALYLQSQGKEWGLDPSLSSGIAIYTGDSLSDNESRNLGRAGFIFQTGIGVILTSFERTRSSDFTKGWVGMKSVQVLSYKGRNHSRDNDFAMIDRGDGNGNFELGLFSLVSSFNLLKSGSQSFNVVKGKQGLWEWLSASTNNLIEKEELRPYRALNHPQYDSARLPRAR